MSSQSPKTSVGGIQRKGSRRSLSGDLDFAKIRSASPAHVRAEASALTSTESLNAKQRGTSTTTTSTTRERNRRKGLVRSASYTPSTTSLDKHKKKESSSRRGSTTNNGQQKGKNSEETNSSQQKRSSSRRSSKLGSSSSHKGHSSSSNKSSSRSRSSSRARLSSEEQQGGSSSNKKKESRSSNIEKNQKSIDAAGEKSVDMSSMNTVSEDHAAGDKPQKSTLLSSSAGEFLESSSSSVDSPERAMRIMISTHGTFLQKPRSHDEDDDLTSASMSMPNLMESSFSSLHTEATADTKASTPDVVTNRVVPNRSKSDDPLLYFMADMTMAVHQQHQETGVESENKPTSKHEKQTKKDDKHGRDQNDKHGRDQNDKHGRDQNDKRSSSDRRSQRHLVGSKDDSAISRKSSSHDRLKKQPSKKFNKVRGDDTTGAGRQLRKNDNDSDVIHSDGPNQDTTAADETSKKSSSKRSKNQSSESRTPETQGDDYDDEDENINNQSKIPSKNVPSLSHYRKKLSSQHRPKQSDSGAEQTKNPAPLSSSGPIKSEPSSLRSKSFTKGLNSMTQQTSSVASPSSEKSSLSRSLKPTDMESALPNKSPESRSSKKHQQHHVGDVEWTAAAEAEPPPSGRITMINKRRTGPDIDATSQGKTKLNGSAAAVRAKPENIPDARLEGSLASTDSKTLKKNKDEQQQQGSQASEVANVQLDGNFFPQDSTTSTDRSFALTRRKSERKVGGGQKSEGGVGLQHRLRRMFSKRKDLNNSSGQLNNDEQFFPDAVEEHSDRLLNND